MTFDVYSAQLSFYQDRIQASFPHYQAEDLALFLQHFKMGIFSLRLSQ